ncbi:MAG: ubiquinone/menaquinone biosynthesis methyltransferase [Deltaproteobacteria bacterium]|nr:ubiquinone/menaquinone biosynthesis methyltransferase [Deltaproteobacteria bacterium]
MTYLKGPDRAEYVREMFGQISCHYDLINRLMTLGQDRSWRRQVVREALLPKGGRFLDVGTGTGDIALEALRLDSTIRVTAVDFSFRMINVGRGRPGGKKILWCCADALKLPFADATFDAVTSGYLIRNVIDPRRAFEEQMRVVKPGGRVVCLDTAPAPRNVLRLPVLFHLKIVIPLLGTLIARNRAAYRYLSQSTQAFMTPEQLASIMRSAGLKDVYYRRFMFGTMAVHTGLRPTI